MIVRAAAKEDIKTVYRFICKLENIVMDPLLFEEYYLRNLANKDNIYLVAEDNATVVGFLSCHGQYLLHHLDKVFEIQELYVEKSYRSQKVGQLLIEALEVILKDQSYRCVEVTSNAKRTDAHRFYERNGYKHTHFKFTKTLG